MYCDFFNLQTAPFNNTPDPRFFFSTPDHEEALATLLYATQARKGFVVVTGEVGAGKTLLSRLFMKKVQKSATVGTISNPHLNGRDLLASISNAFGLRTATKDTVVELTQQLTYFLNEERRGDQLPVLIIDEAQNMLIDTFEQLRMLSNLETDDAKLLQMIILGQPELAQMIRRPELRQLQQRVARSIHIHAMTGVQTESYITHRLEVAGAMPNSVAFDSDAIQRIFSFSGGIPRLTNLVCDNALLSAYAQSRRLIEMDIIDEVIQDLAGLHGPAPDAPSASPGSPPPHSASIDTPSQIQATEHNTAPIAPQTVAFQDASLRLTLRQAEIAQAHLDATVNKLIEHRATAERTNAELAKFTSKAEDVLTKFEAAAVEIPARLDELWDICQLSEQHALEFKIQAKAWMDLTSAMRSIFQHADGKAESLQLEVEQMENRILKITSDGTAALRAELDLVQQQTLEISNGRTSALWAEIEQMENHIVEITDQKTSAMRSEIERLEELINKISEGTTSTLRDDVRRGEQLIAELTALTEPEQLPGLSQSMRQLLDHGNQQSQRLKSLLEEAREFESKQIQKVLELTSRITGTDLGLSDNVTGQARLRRLADRAAQLTEVMKSTDKQNRFSTRTDDRSCEPAPASRESSPIQTEVESGKS